MTKVTVTYLGPKSVVIAGRHLMEGESREVEVEHLNNVLLTHPRQNFRIQPYEPEEPADVPEGDLKADLEEPPAISDPIEVIDDATIDKIKAIASETTDVMFVEDLIEQEKAGKNRKGALDALEARLAELTADQGEEPEAGE
jgi:hypothetical protein